MLRESVASHIYGLQVARTFKASELENIYTLEPDDYWETYGAESQQVCFYMMLVLIHCSKHKGWH